MGVKTTTRTIKTIKQIVKNISKNTNSLSNAGAYKIRCQNCNKFYIGKTSRNLNKIHGHKKTLLTGNRTNFLVSHKILTKHTLDFKNFAIFAFIHYKNKRIIIGTFSLTHRNTTTTFLPNFTICRKNNIKRIQVTIKISSPFSKHSTQLNVTNPFLKPQNSITWHDAIWTFQPVLILFFI